MRYDHKQEDKQGIYQNLFDASTKQIHRIVNIYAAKKRLHKDSGI